MKKISGKKRWLALIEIIDEGMTSLFEVTAVDTAGRYKLIELSKQTHGKRKIALTRKT